MKKFNIINKNGITLKTANTYVNEDINIRLPEADNLKLIPENIKQGVSILGVEGTVIVPEGTYNITANGSYDIANYAPRAKVIQEDETGVQELMKYDDCVFLFMSSKDIYKFEEKLILAKSSIVITSCCSACGLASVVGFAACACSSARR